MKKLLLGSMTLLIFSASVIIFQVSCSKEANAKDDDGEGNGKLVLFRKDTNSPDPAEINQLWLMNSNGGNKRRVNVTFPGPDYFIATGRLVDNGTKIIMTISKINESGDNYYVFFKCNLDGSGLQQLFQSQQFENFQLQDVY